MLSVFAGDSWKLQLQVEAFPSEDSLFPTGSFDGVSRHLRLPEGESLLGVHATVKELLSDQQYSLAEMLLNRRSRKSFEHTGT